jgi:hypothetical protein
MLGDALGHLVVGCLGGCQEQHPAFGAARQLLGEAALAAANTAQYEYQFPFHF